jgi:hypothetical protein
MLLWPNIPNPKPSTEVGQLQTGNSTRKG